MSTAGLYVELTLIGLQTSVWIASLFSLLIGKESIREILCFMKGLPESIFIIGILYIVGVLFDRLADELFKRVETSAKNEQHCQLDSTILIWKKANQQEYFNFIRSKIRILRSSCINVPLTTIFFVINMVVYKMPISLIFATAFLGVAFSIASVLGLWKSLCSFYSKAVTLEKNI